MSNDDFLKEVGRLTIAKRAAQQRRSALHQRIKTAGSVLDALALLLMRELMDERDLRAAAALIDPLVSTGGLEEIKRDIRELLECEQEISRISRELNG
jgi:hypothetical protein